MNEIMSAPSGASRRNVLKTGALGIGALAAVVAAGEAVAAPAAAAPIAAGAASGGAHYTLVLGGQKADGTTGGATTMIPLSSIAWGATAPIASAAAGAGAGKVSFNPFSFTAPSSAASPTLFTSVVTAKRLPTATVTGTTTGAHPYVFLTIALQNVGIATYEQTASNEHPQDEFTLTYTNIKVSYRQQSGSASSSSGSATTTGSGGWNIVKNAQG